MGGGAVAERDGIGQWPYLRKAGWWIPAGALGTAVGWAVGGAVFGAVVGLGQWLVLRPYLRKVGWWVSAGALGWALGLAVAEAVFRAVDRTVGWAVNQGDFVMVGAVGSAVAGAIYGLLTGLVLLWLLRHPKADEAR